MNEIEGYVNNNTVTGKDVYELLDTLCDHFQWTRREKILDIGCGPGDVTANVLLPVLPKDSLLVGCDLSDAMIEYSNKYGIDGRLEFKKLDIQQKELGSEWEKEYFDKIFSFYCLHWITDHRQAIQNIYSLLKPNGQVLLMLLTPDDPLYISFEKLKASAKWNSFMKDIKWFYESNDPISYWEDLLKGTGFRDVACYLKKTRHRIASWRVYMDLVRAISPFLCHIPAYLKSGYIAELEEFLKQQRHIELDEANGEIIIEYNLIIAAAKKPIHNQELDSSEMHETEGYVGNNTITGKDVYELLDTHSAHFQWTRREKVLDIGCGPGDVTANVLLPVLPKDSLLVGCDLSDAMLEYCNKYGIDGRLEFKKLDIQQKELGSEWEKEYFDKIFSFYCLHWITDHRQAVQNIYSLLKPNGLVLLMLLTPDNAIYIAFEKLKASPKWNSFMKDIKWFYESDEPISFWKDLLKNIGFQYIECYLKKTEHRFAFWKNYIDLVRTVNPFLRHIPNDMKPGYIAELQELLKQQRHIVFDEDSGEIIIEYNNLVVAAAKTNQFLIN